MMVPGLPSTSTSALLPSPPGSLFLLFQDKPGLSQPTKRKEDALGTTQRHVRKLEAGLST